MVDSYMHCLPRATHLDWKTSQVTLQFEYAERQLNHEGFLGLQ